MNLALSGVMRSCGALISEVLSTTVSVTAELLADRLVIAALRNSDLWRTGKRSRSVGMQSGPGSRASVTLAALAAA